MLANISSVTTPTPRSTKPVSAPPKPVNAIIDCHAGSEDFARTHDFALPLPKNTNRTWRLSVASVPVPPPSGSRVGRILKVYLDLKAVPNEAIAIQVTGGKQLSGFKKDLRKYAEKDGYYAKFSRNAESTVLYCWLVKKEAL